MPAVRRFRSALPAIGLAVLMAACRSGDNRASFSGGVQPTDGAGHPMSAPSSSTAPALTRAEIVLAPDGLGPVPFGTQAAQALKALTQALGRAESFTVVPPSTGCGATRIFRWKDLAVLVNEVSARSGARPGLVGWSVAASASPSLGLQTGNGISVDSTVAAVRKAYGASVAIAQGEHGPVLTIQTPNGVITGQLDGPSETSRVSSLEAGVSCPV